MGVILTAARGQITLQTHIVWELARRFYRAGRMLLHVSVSVLVSL